MTEPLDPGAYNGHEPEREAESIPDGIGPEDERVAAYDSRPGVEGEPDETSPTENEIANGDQSLESRRGR